MEVVRLYGEGQLLWHKRRWEKSRALRRQRVGIQRVADRAIVYFCNTPIWEFHLPTGTSFSIRRTSLGLFRTEGERASLAGPFPHPFPLLPRI
jgi:hypothetical protein